MFSVLVAVILYFSESGARIKQRHYQAWLVIDAAQGKGGNGGRIEAMQELNHDGVSLVGIQADNAFLLDIRLNGGHLDRCDMDSSDLRNSVFDRATLTFCNLQSANFRGATLIGTDLTDANLSRANLTRANLSRADLRHADLRRIVWRDIQSIRLANIKDVKNPPPGFVEWAMGAGAVSFASDEEWNAQIQQSKSNAPASQ
jgi:hypothetical protein